MIRTRRPLLALSALSLAAALAGCGDTGSDAGDEPTPTSTQSADDSSADPTDTSEDAAVTSEEPAIGDKPTHTQIAPGGGEASLPLGTVPDGTAERADVQEAIAAEAERSGVEPDAVGIAGYADVTWSDGSIGCPRPGMMYTQALVPGHQLVLEVDGSYASYHAAEGKPFSYCAQPVAPSSSESHGGTISDR
ncbi:hypothetical protein [Serinicoccus profundi]|uniref:hypothetical protein n=1 Tax=Serinicoccus profundi TaxID=1078471 RepID=UPI000255E83D|nr:hypothetical protein [Serinicoccus profundi]